MDNHFGYISNSHLYRAGDRFFHTTGEWNYLKCMAKYAAHIDVFSLVKDREPAADAVFLDGKTIQVHEIPRRSYFRSAFTFRKFVKNWNFCFLMAPSWYSYGAYLSCRKHKVPFAVCFRGDWQNRAKLESRFRPVMQPLSAMAEGSFIKYAAIRMGEGGLLKDRYRDLADSILPCLTTEIPLDIFQQRSKPLFEEGQISLLFVGNLIALKGVDILLSAISEINKTRRIQLVVAGTGPIETKLKAQAHELGIGDHVRFVGQVPFETLLVAYRNADIFVLPSYSEGFPRVVLEAFSQALPVITTPVGAQKICLSDNRECLFTEPGDVKKLVENILCLADNPETAQEIGSRGFEFAKDLFENHPVSEFETELAGLLVN